MYHRSVQAIVLRTYIQYTDVNHDDFHGLYYTYNHKLQTLFFFFFFFVSVSISSLCFAWSPNPSNQCTLQSPAMSCSFTEKIAIDLHPPKTMSVNRREKPADSSKGFVITTSPRFPFEVKKASHCMGLKANRLPFDDWDQPWQRRLFRRSVLVTLSWCQFVHMQRNGLWSLVVDFTSLTCSSPSIKATKKPCDSRIQTHSSLWSHYSYSNFRHNIKLWD